VIGGLVKSNFPVRLAGSVASPEDAKVATGIASTGAEKLLGQGDFLVVAKGETTRMQAAYTGEGEIHRIVERVREHAGTAWLLPDAATGTDGAPPRNGLQTLARLRSRLRLVK
jgi:S-DNA-T family DNA segregation ATPase FtsK/SpoIIIE